LARGRTNVRAPITGLWYDSWSDEQTELAQRLACAALGAQKWFAAHASEWALPLPVSVEELGSLDCGGTRQPTPRMQLRYEFAASLRHHEWDFLRHPEWRPYAYTVMAYEHASEFIRHDRELCEEFSPQKFVELWGPGTTNPLHWCSPEKAARDKAFWEFHRLRDEGVPFDEARKISGWHRGA